MGGAKYGIQPRAGNYKKLYIRMREKRRERERKGGDPEIFQLWVK